MMKYLTSVSIVLLLLCCVAGDSLIDSNSHAVEQADSAPDAKLLELRSEIDTINRDILELLNKRAEVVLKIGELKKENSMPLYDAQREKQIEDELVKLNTGPMPNKSVIKIFREIISACRELQ